MLGASRGLDPQRLFYRRCGYNEPREERHAASDSYHRALEPPLDRFLALLGQHEVEALVDIRRFPGSRKHPHFNRDNLAAAVPKSGVEYHWLEALGGRRPKQRDESPNLGLENQGFRNYADYMLTDAFREGVEQLLEFARRNRSRVVGDSTCLP
jgi:uncharacterized protein (DUF488 family)